MAVDTPARHVYTGNGNIRVFPIPTRIIGDDYVRIEIDGIHLTDRTQWDIVNNSVIFLTAPINGSEINIQVATSEEALSVLGSVTNVDIVADNIEDINDVVNSITNINTTATNIVNVNIVASNTTNVNTVADNMNSVVMVVNDLTNINAVASNETNIDIAASNITEIQNASANASIATTKALEASNSATSAYNSSVSAGNSSANASNSEIKANKWADNNYNVEVEAGKYSAKHWATVSKNSIGVKVVENISSLKTFNINEANQIEVLGYYNKGDGGGGLFYWDNTSTETDNGGTIIQATGITTGRWKRVFSGAVNVKWFGDNPYFNKDLDTFANAVKITENEDSVHLHLFGKVYQSEGAQVADYKGTFLHTYRPMEPFPSDGANTFLGGRAGNLTMAPDSNAIGNYLIQASYNTGIGTQALGSLTTGYNNTAVGVNAGRANTEGYGGTFIGRDSGHNNDIGFANTAIGQASLFSNTTGNYSTAVGVTALNKSNGNSNTAIGFSSLKEVTSGINNIGIGDSAGLGITTGSNNTIIGKDINIGDVSNTIVISAGTNKRIYVDSTGKYGLNGNAPTAPIEYTRSENTAYNPIATDGQLEAGAGLYLQQGSGSSSAVSQIVFRTRPLQPFNRIVNAGGANPFMAFCTNDSERLRISYDGHITPYVDNAQNLGNASKRFSVIYAGTGTINTSDDREKTYLDITEVEKQVALELKANMKKFKLNSSIAEKGEEKARIHFGTSAQTVKSIFEKYGLNGFDYAILCYDEWEDVFEQVIDKDEVLDENGDIIEEAIYKNGNIIRPAGNRYGIRYEELLCFIISAL